MEVFAHCDSSRESSHSVLLLLGRVCIAMIFILAGIGKLLHPKETEVYMALQQMSFIPVCLYGAATVEIIGGISIFIGWKARHGATLLCLYLIVLTIIFHNFWDLPLLEKDIQRIEFLKNLAIFGGLLYIRGSGAGKISIDNLCLRIHRKT